MRNGSATTPAPNFTVAASSPAMTLSADGSGTTAISLNAANGFTGTVQLQCQNLPQTLTCSFSPSLIHVQKGARASSQLAITATRSTAAMHSSGQDIFAMALLPILGGMFFWRRPRAIKKEALLKAALPILLASLLLFCGCGASAPVHDPNSQSYMVNVTATAWNGTSHSVQVHVIVQQ